jgi:hypothetical protein
MPRTQQQIRSVVKDVWDYLDLNKADDTTKQSIKHVLDVVGANSPSDPNFNEMKKNFDSMSFIYPDIVDKILEEFKRNKPDPVKEERKKRNQFQKSRPNLSALSANEKPPVYEEAPDFWLETTPQLRELQKSTKRSTINKYISEELEALKSTYMFKYSLDPKMAEKIYGPINYWMFSNIIYQTGGEKSRYTKQERIMVYLVAKMVYEQIFKFWNSIDWSSWTETFWDEESEKRVSMSRLQKERLKEIKDFHNRKLMEASAYFSFEDVLDYLLGMQTFENNPNNALSDEQKQVLKDIKQKMLYPLLFQKFRNYFKEDFPIQQLSDSATIKNIKAKLHKLRCSFLPNWLCNLLFTSSFSDKQREKYFKQLVKQDIFGDDFKLKRIDMDKIQV